MNSVTAQACKRAEAQLFAHAWSGEAALDVVNLEGGLGGLVADIQHTTGRSIPSGRAERGRTTSRQP